MPGDLHVHIANINLAELFVHAWASGCQLTTQVIGNALLYALIKENIVFVGK